MEYVFPNKRYAKISDQFMLGNDILIAPLLSKGKRSRKVVLPKGKWKSDSGKIYRGNTNIEIQVPLNRLPYFIKL
jgi:alpha-glucosidase